MTRFVWLQSRTQTLVAAAALGALAVAAAITGIQLSHLYDRLVVHCYPGCSLATSQFVSHQQFLQRGLDIVAQIAPALVGIFWGAPLVARELETGTYRLAWTQSVTRSRWLLTKTAVVGAATILLAGLLTLTITWWFRAIDHVSSNQYALFDRRDIAPIGYAAFALASGALIGAVIRRTVPAMATTLGVYAFTRVATATWIRPHLIAAAHQTSALDPTSMGYGTTGSGPDNLFPGTPHLPNAWIYTTRIVDTAGHALNPQYLKQACPLLGTGLPPPGPGPGSGQSFETQAPAAAQTALHDCVNKLSATYHLVVTYQPANRYWTFQWLETAIFTALALAAAVGCFWWVTRRTS